MAITTVNCGDVLTAAKLNEMVAKLNQMEQVLAIPEPLFQRQELGTSDHPGISRVWRYIIMHRAVNRYLRFRWEWMGTSGSPLSHVFVGDNVSSFPMDEAQGVHDGNVDLSTIPSIGGAGGANGAGKLYVVRFEVDLSVRTYFKLHFLFEAPNA